MGADASKPGQAVEEQLDPASKNRMIAKMDEAVRSRIRGGIQYNMKVILCGSRGTGKTSLWYRFQGMTFTSEYFPTPEIQSATINWTFKNYEDHVKVEVWDVVDIALSKNKKGVTSTSGIATTTPTNIGGAGKHVLELLDSSVVDIYKGTQAVIFLVNPNSIHSLVYVRDKYKEVPLDISILILLNFKDVKIEGNSANRVTMAEINSLCGEINAYRQQARSPVATTLSANSYELNKKLTNVKIDTLAETAAAAAAATAAEASSNSTTQCETNNNDKKDSGNSAVDADSSMSAADSAQDAISKLSLANIDSIASTHHNANPAPAAPLARHMIDGNSMLNSGNDSVHAFEVSMVNCFGLMQVHKFLDLPFLRLKRQTILEQLNRLEADMTASNTGLRSDVSEANYEVYVEGYDKRQKERAAQIAAGQLAAPQIQAQHLAAVTQWDGGNTTGNQLGSYVSAQGVDGPLAAGGRGNVTNSTADSIHDSMKPAAAAVMSPHPMSMDTSDSEDGGGGNKYIALKKTKLVKGKRSSRTAPVIAIPQTVEPTTPNSGGSTPNATPNTTFKLAHDDSYEDLGYHKKNSVNNALNPQLTAEPTARDKKKSSKKNKDSTSDNEKTTATNNNTVKTGGMSTSNSGTKISSQFELEFESFRPTAGPATNARDTLESFFEPSDDEERARIEHKNRVRQFIRPNSSDNTAQLGGSPLGGSGTATLHDSEDDEVSKKSHKSKKHSSSSSTSRDSKSKRASSGSSSKDISNSAVDVMSVFDEPAVTAKISGGLRKPVRKSKTATPAVEDV